MNLHNRDRRSGITGVWVSLMGLIMVGFLGLAIDTSYVGRTIQELQTAADSASLAGAAQVKTNIDAARTQAQLLVFNNTAGMIEREPCDVLLDLNTDNSHDGDIVTGRWYRWDDNTTIPPHPAGDFDIEATEGINAVKVVARRIEDTDDDAAPAKTPLPLLFGPLLGPHHASMPPYLTLAACIAASGGAAGSCGSQRVTGSVALLSDGLAPWLLLVGACRPVR